MMLPERLDIAKRREGLEEEEVGGGQDDVEKEE